MDVQVQILSTALNERIQKILFKLTMSKTFCPFKEDLFIGMK